MVINFQILLILLALRAKATSLDGLRDLSLANLCDSAENITERLNAMHITDFESILIKGANIWTETRYKEMKNTVLILDSEIAKTTMHPDSSSSAAALLHGFLEASGDAVDKTVDDIVKTALISHSFNLLQTLTTLYVWSTSEKFHWFQALGYKSPWYNETLWQTHTMDWSRHLAAICKADNLILLNDIKSGIISENPLMIDTDTLFELVAKYDSLKIYQSLTFIPHKHLKTLAESGSFKILRYIYETKTIELHLEDYPLPHTLPEDFGFFWMQGYRYLSALRFLSMACKHGRDDILTFFHRLESSTLIPNHYNIVSAVKNGHLNILKWALNHKLPIRHLEIGLVLVMHRHFKAFEQLQEILVFSPHTMQEISNEAAKKDQISVVKWLYDKFKIVPKAYALSRTSTKMLEWIEVVKPQAIDKKMADGASLTTLKWLVEKYPRVLTDEIRKAHNSRLVDFEKMQWMILQGWKTSPDLREAARVGEIEMLKFGYNSLQMKPTKEHVNLATAWGHVKILELIYSINPLYIDQTSLLKAVEHGHLETAQYLESILNFKGMKLHFNLKIAFSSGNLELVEWVYQNYNFDLFESNWLRKTIKYGHLHVIDWALEEELILTDDTMYLKCAALYGQHLIFQRLISFGMNVTKLKDHVLSAFCYGSLEIVKYLVTRDPESAEILKDKKACVHNYHIMQWLRDYEDKMEKIPTSVVPIVM